MRKSFLSGILLLTASVLLPSCVDSSDDPSATDPLAVATEDNPLAGDETAGSRELEPAGEGPTGPISFTAWDCGDNKLCLWDLPGFDNVNGYKVGLSGGGCHNLGGWGMNDRASSWFNRDSVIWTLYRDHNCQGSSAKLRVNPGERAGQMAPYWDNNLSSACRGSGCP